MQKVYSALVCTISTETLHVHGFYKGLFELLCHLFMSWTSGRGTVSLPQKTNSQRPTRKTRVNNSLLKIASCTCKLSIVRYALVENTCYRRKPPHGNFHSIDISSAQMLPKRVNISRQDRLESCKYLLQPSQLKQFHRFTCSYSRVITFFGI